MTEINKKWKSITLILMIVVSISLIVNWYQTAGKNHHAAITFCEELIPKLEAYKNENGVYPTLIEKDWIKGKTIPKLIRIKDFYLKTEKGYLLRFRDPSFSFLGNDIYGYHGMPPWDGKWLNYDGY